MKKLSLICVGFLIGAYITWALMDYRLQSKTAQLQRNFVNDTADLKNQNLMYHQLFIEQVSVAYPDKGIAWILAAASRVGADTNRLVIPGDLR